MSGFAGNPLRVESTPSGRYRLTHPLEYRTRCGRVIRVPIDFTTDFFSVPRVLWSLFPRDRRGRRAAVVHDWLYEAAPDHGMTKADADRIFREALDDLHVNWFARWAMWAGVRLNITGGNW